MVLILTVAGGVCFWLLDPNALGNYVAQSRVTQGNRMRVGQVNHGRHGKHGGKGYVYGTNSRASGDISQQQLARDARAGYPLKKLGEIAMPVQKGMRVGIHVSIFQGTSVTALAYGAGTAIANEKMGQGNYALSAHNMANNSTYFSPLQNELSANQRPYIFVTDHKRIYEYRVFSQNNQPKGKFIVPLTDTAVLDQPANDHPQITLTTCYEIPPDYANAQNRVIVKGGLVRSVSWHEAPSSQKKLFFNRQ
ncbi:class A sortase [Levilactobacillus brevis]|uniref:class A sortase n=1 Tax=Levilactobacillus brevis TaxID=1580 RepID=UPI00058045EC|nr:class A sortase [Levilactobacillus brevis]